MTTTQTTNRQQALDEFVTRVGKITAAIEVIKVATDEHFGIAPEEVHWGHVGDAGRILAGLQEIVQTIEGD